MRPPTQLLDLPDEVLLQILSYLPSSSILKTLRVSKRFHATYHASSLLQYIVALHTTYQEDVEECILPPSEKLKLLRERDERWRSLKWKKQQTVSCGEAIPHMSSLSGEIYTVVSTHSPCRGHPYNPLDRGLFHFQGYVMDDGRYALGCFKMPSHESPTFLEREFVNDIVIQEFQIVHPFMQLVPLVRLIAARVD